MFIKRRKNRLIVFSLIIMLVMSIVSCTDVGNSASLQKIERIAFSAKLNHSANDEVYSINADGTDLINLTNNSADDRWPSWSPDGQLIAFCSNRDGQDRIYLMNADGSNQHMLTNVIKACSNPNTMGLYWSPDSKWIGTSYPPNGTTPDEPTDVYLISADGNQVINITNDPASDWGLSWSPDSKRVSFCSDRDSNLETYIVNIDGTGLMRLTDDPGRDSLGAWSLDGKQLLFLSNREGHVQIYSMHPDGAEQTNLTKSSSNDSQPVWLPDGRIAFISDRTGQWKLFTMNSDGTEQVRVTNSEESETQFWWSPDGKMVAINSFTGQPGDPNASWSSKIFTADGIVQSTLSVVVGWFSWKP